MIDSHEALRKLVQARIEAIEAEQAYVVALTDYYTAGNAELSAISTTEPTQAGVALAVCATYADLAKARERVDAANNAEREAFRRFCEVAGQEYRRAK
jgi:hypothetical protein